MQKELKIVPTCTATLVVAIYVLYRGVIVLRNTITTCFKSNKCQSDSLDHVQTILLFKCQIFPGVPFCVLFRSMFCIAVKILFLLKTDFN